MSLASLIRVLLPKNHFARSVSVLAGGTAGGQAILVLAAPVLTRLYTPEDFGVFAIFAAMLAILGVLASLRYQLAIPLPGLDEDADQVLVLSLLVVVVMAVVAAVAVLLFREHASVALGIPSLASYLWLLPIGLLFVGSHQVGVYWAVRVKSFPVLAKVSITQSLATVGVQLAGFSLGPLALILGQVFGQALGSASLLIRAIGSRMHLLARVTLTDILKAAKRYRRLPLYSTWAGLFNAASHQLPAVFFAVLFSPSAAGLYLVAHRVLAMPLNMVGGAIAHVFFSKASEAHRNDALAPLVADVHDKLAHIGMPVALILVFAGPSLFSWVFGESWREAGQFAQWMAPWLYLMFVSSPLSTLFFVTETHGQELFFQALLLAARLLALLVGAIHGDLLFAVALFAVASALCYLYLLVWIFRRSGNALASAFHSVAGAMIWGLLVSLPLLVGLIIDTSDILWFSAILLASVLTVSRYAFLARKFRLYSE